MTLSERRNRLENAKKMYQQTQTRIRRLNTALKNWERRVKMHENAIQKSEREVLVRRVRELETILGKPGKRAISLESEATN